MSDFFRIVISFLSGRSSPVKKPRMDFFGNFEVFNLWIYPSQYLLKTVHFGRNTEKSKGAPTFNTHPFGYGMAKILDIDLQNPRWLPY